MDARYILVISQDFIILFSGEVNKRSKVTKIQGVQLQHPCCSGYNGGKFTNMYHEVVFPAIVYAKGHDMHFVWFLHVRWIYLTTVLNMGESWKYVRNRNFNMNQNFTSVNINLKIC